MCLDDITCGLDVTHGYLLSYKSRMVHIYNIRRDVSYSDAHLLMIRPTVLRTTTEVKGKTKYHWLCVMRGKDRRIDS
jgi:hypothetical protein